MDAMDVVRFIMTVGISIARKILFTIGLCVY